MTFGMVDGVFTISTSAVMTTALAAVLLMIGFWIKGKVKVLNKYCIPAPVVGGFPLRNRSQKQLNGGLR